MAAISASGKPFAFEVSVVGAAVLTAWFSASTAQYAIIITVSWLDVPDYYLVVRSESLASVAAVPLGPLLASHLGFQLIVAERVGCLGGLHSFKSCSR